MVVCMDCWVDEQVWASRPAADATTFEVVVVDEQLGSLVVLREPGGLEVIGADSPRSGGDC